MVDDDLENIYSYVADTREHTLVGKTNEGYLLGSMAEEKRTKVKPNRKDYSGVICQIVSEFNEDGETKRYLGTGSIQVADNCNKLFIVTCAHNFVQECEDFDTVDLNYAARSTIFLSRDGKGEFLFKAPILNYVVHPEYLKRPRIHDGFDIAVATFELNDALPPVDDIDRFKRKCIKYMPYFTASHSHNTGDSILIIGYPGEKHGFLYQMEGTIYATKKRKAGTEVIIYRDIDTTCGQSGAPVYKKDEDGEWEIIGIHVGYFKKKKANLATLITHKLKHWIVGCIEGQIPLDLDFDPKVHRAKQVPLNKTNSSAAIQKLLLEIDHDQPSLNSDFVLKLDGSNPSHKKFIHEVQTYTFPNYKSLQISNLQGFTTKEELEDLFEFLSTSTPDKLKYLMLSSNDHIKIGPFMEVFSHLFEVITNEIYLDSFSIDEEDLKQIFSKA